MVEAKLLRFTMLSVCIALLALVLKCQMPESGWQRSVAEIARKQQNYRAVVTSEEINSFILLWPQFKELGFADNLVVSYRIDRPSKFLNWQTKMWFVYHKWDADRFFYVQQRLAYLLYMLKVRRNAKSIISQLEERKSKLALSMIDLHQKRMEINDSNDAELALVEQNEQTLRKLFE